MLKSQSSVCDSGTTSTSLVERWEELVSKELVCVSGTIIWAELPSCEGGASSSTFWVGGDMEGVTAGVEGPSMFERNSSPNADEQEFSDICESENCENRCRLISSSLCNDMGFHGNFLVSLLVPFFWLIKTFAFLFTLSHFFSGIEASSLGEKSSVKPIALAMTAALV